MNRKAADRMTQYAAQNGTDDTDKLIAYAHALATRYGEAAAALACQMYDQTAAAAGAAVPPAEPADTATYGETAAAILGTLKQSTLPQSVGNSTGRLVKQAASDTTLKNAKRDHAEFAWIPSGDGCSYCMMIASNGWRPASKATANGGHADHIHPNCQCEFAIRFSKDDGVAGYDPEKYKRIFDHADGDTWHEKIRSLDWERYAENADAINARKRAEYRKRKLSKIKATGGNHFKRGFSQANLEKHFGKNGKHTSEYKGWTQEKYNDEALKLVQSATSDDILGYKTEDLSVVRYRRSTNDFAKGYPETGIATMFKPKDREGYFYRRLKKEKGIQHD